jgi:hypothetical protein
MGRFTVLNQEEIKMPKDPTENIGHYKVEGGHLNEFEFQKNQERMAEEEERNRFQQQELVRSQHEDDAPQAPKTEGDSSN